MEKTLILEIGGEGGSISLYNEGDIFYHMNNEAAMMDMLDEEDYKDIKAILDKRKTEVFHSFESAMESMVDKYPVFRLYPLEIRDQFKGQIKKYYQNYITKDKKAEYLRNKKWEEILKIAAKTASKKL